MASRTQVEKMHVSFAALVSYLWGMFCKSRMLGLHDPGSRAVPCNDVDKVLLDRYTFKCGALPVMHWSHPCLP